MQLACPHCQQPNEVDTRYPGFVVGCVHCSQPFTIPHLPPEPPAPSQVVVEHHYHEEAPDTRRPRKSLLAYKLLCFFFGTLGVHNFYAGRGNVGVVQLLISFTCVGLVVTCIWCLVELFTVEQDGDGRDMV